MQAAVAVDGEPEVVVAVPARDMEGRFRAAFQTPCRMDRRPLSTGQHPHGDSEAALAVVVRRQIAAQHA